MCIRDRQCNVILNRVDGIADMAEAEKKNIKGEMCFLRGLMYFNLVRIFGDVLLVIKETTNPNDFFGQVRTPKEEVYKPVSYTHLSELRVGISLRNYLITMTKNHILNVIRNENTALTKNYEIAHNSW